MSVTAEQIWEVYEGLRDLAQGKETTNDLSDTKLAGKMQVNGADCWPRSTINDVLRAGLQWPTDVHKVFRKLQELKIIQGPHKTARRVDGHKTNYELYFVSFKVLLRWEDANADSAPE